MSKTLPRYNSEDRRPDFDRRLTLRDPEARDTVLGILSDVESDGWAAVQSYSEQFDDHRPEQALSPERLPRAREELGSKQREAFEVAERRVRRYQTAIKPSSRTITDGPEGLLGQVVRPIETVGCYVPGGRFPLPSTVFMTALVAEVAGVDRIVVASPPVGSDGEPHPEILAALSHLSDPEVFALGGAQAIGAMAYGTGPVPEVDLIAGPGNLYVTLAKKEVFGRVGIDLLAGPSEIAVVATPGASRPDWVAADLLSQAEHDPRARSFCLSPDESFLDEVEDEVGNFLSEHPNPDPVREALDHSGLVRTRSVEEAVEMTNELAPEHLELHLPEASRWARECRNAGAVFCGAETPEPIGDYVAGPSHTLPTQGSARFFSPLSVDTFMKQQTFVRTGGDRAESLREHGETFAEMESLWAHGRSLSVRDEDGGSSP